MVDDSRRAIPPDVLPVDLIHRAVRRLFEAEGDEPPAAPTIRFVNLSICDPVRPLMRQMSAWARLLDWLSWKYQILFIVSAGNHGHDIELEISRSSLDSLAPDQREQTIIKAVAKDTRNRRLLSPAETLNGLTVGAVHQDASRSAGTNLIDPFVQTSGPNVASAHGPGYRRAIKPDVLLPGGRQLLTEKLGSAHTNATLRIANLFSPPGQRVAAPGRPRPVGSDVLHQGHQQFHCGRFARSHPSVPPDRSTSSATRRPRAAGIRCGADEGSY